MSAAIPPSSADNAFTWRVRVYYEDTDASGVVYHARYLTYFERARTEWLRSMGFGQTALAAELGAVFTVASASVAFRQPARLDDELAVTATVARIRRASLAFEQVIHRGADVIATGSFRVGCVDAVDYRPRAIPNTLVQELS